MRIGEEVRVSTPVSTASAHREALDLAVERRAALRGSPRWRRRAGARAQVAQASRRACTTARTLAERVDGLAARGSRRPAGPARCSRRRRARRRAIPSARWNAMPASGLAAGIVAPASMPTTMPALALRSLREYWLMPLVTTRPGSRGRRHHRAARAHAEAVDRAAVAARGAPACSRRRRGADGRRCGPKRARSISDCGCSMRKPIENGLASMCTPRACSISKVSRALWPSASTTWSASQSCSPPASVTPRTCRCRLAVLDQQVVDALLEADLAAQRARSARACFSTIVTSRKVPMCGLLT